MAGLARRRAIRSAAGTKAGEILGTFWRRTHLMSSRVIAAVAFEA